MSAVEIFIPEIDLIFSPIAKKYSTLFLFAALTSGVFCNVQAQQTKIGFIDTQRVFRESGAAKTADAKIAQEFSIRDKELKELAARFKKISEKLDKDAPTLAESERAKRVREVSDLSRDIQRKQAEFREDLNQRQNREHSIFSDRALAVVKKISETENFDLVVDKAAWSGPKIDITDRVIKALEK